MPKDVDRPAGAARALLGADIDRLHEARRAVATVVVGQTEAIDQVFVALLSGGHVLVESIPGLGKTLLVRTLGAVCGLEFSRIQFTPDLMPADITGTITLLPDSSGRGATTFQRGPIFAQMVLTDEVNRATPKTQSALLEAMQELTVTVAGTRHELPRPFFVVATQNPIEMEGTYLLPEAQVDRFLFKVNLPFPSEADVVSILGLTTGTGQAEPAHVLGPEDILRLQALTREVPVPSRLLNAVARLVHLTQPQLPGAPADVRRYVRFGVSPRGAQSLVLAAKAHALMQGRFNVDEEDLRAVALPALRHRFQINYEGEADAVDAESMVLQLLETALKRQG